MNGSYRTQGVLQFPKPSSCRVTVKFGASTVPSAATTSSNNANTTNTSHNSTELPVPLFLSSLSPIPSWQLGPVYFFEDLPTYANYFTYFFKIYFNFMHCRDTEVFLLYTVGPNYAAGLKTDMALPDVLESFSEKNARIPKYKYYM